MLYNTSTINILSVERSDDLLVPLSYRYFHIKTKIVFNVLFHFIKTLYLGTYKIILFYFKRKIRFIFY